MAKKTAKKSTSGLTGGSSTSAGLNYQVDLAIHSALDQISRFLVNPLLKAQIAMEPRVGCHGVTCWDVRTAPPEVVIEAKLKPRKDEIIEWLDRVEEGTTHDDRREFGLLYSRGESPIIRAIATLCRISREVGGDEKQFRILVDHEKSPEIDLSLKHVRAQPRLTFQRVHVRPFEVASLQHDIVLVLRFLTHQSQRQSLYNFLFTTFHKGLEKRLTFEIPELVAEIKSLGIELLAPPTFEEQSLSEIARDAVCILQSCDVAVSESTLASALGIDINSLRQELTPYVTSRLMVNDEGTWRMVRLGSSFSHPQSSTIIGNALLQILEFIVANKTGPLGWSQVPNAIALGKLCELSHSDLVASLFRKLDKLLKRSGNKRLVLEVANLSICAARRGQTRLHREGEAVALICGKSWVYQRIDRLPAARAEGEMSLELGKQLGWDRNTAFCLKCLGRLCRMEAERLRDNPGGRHDLLNKSISYLKEAIDFFPLISELSPSDRDSEVGDCYSLLGRTYLVAGALPLARDAAKEAQRRLSDETSKDFADLQILHGDLALAGGGSRVDAAAYYEDAIRTAGTADAERSEIAARAWFQLGLANNRDWHFFDRAAEIWEKLDEQKLADRARWESKVRQGLVSDRTRQLMVNESMSVRVEALRLHDDQVKAIAGPNRGRRTDASDKHWQELLVQANQNVAVNHREW